MSKIDYVTIDVTLLNFTEGPKSAALLEIDGAEYWIPRSTLSYRSDQLINEDNLAEHLEVQIARWKAERDGLI